VQAWAFGETGGNKAQRARCERRSITIELSFSGGAGISLLEQGIMEGENPVHDPELAAYDLRSKSRVAWECNVKWVVSFI